MNSPPSTSPAIVAQSAVRRLPRAALWLLGLAYVLPGFLGREPWMRADISSFGYMAELAAGHTDWLAPKLGALAPEFDGLLPYWLGAWAIKLAPAWIAPAFAARIPFIALLAVALLAVWHAVYYLARSPLAQPVAFAFGGEAAPKDYARAMADGGLLAFIASMGLAQLSHETTVAAAQLCFVALAFYAYAALPYHRWSPFFSAAIGLTGLTLSGAPFLALMLSAVGLLAHWLDRAQARENPARHRHGLWRLLALTLFTTALASALGLWQGQAHWSALRLPDSARYWNALGQLLLWFLWPIWPLVLWTLWRWQRQLFGQQPSRHLTLPLWWALITVGATLFTPAGDRALLLALPALAALAAFALPTMSRSVTALIDWFTLIFFTLAAIFIWVYWIAMLTGVPPQPAETITRLAPGFTPRFYILPFVFAALGTLAWAWLVRWRTGHHRAALWKSLVLPAGGTILCWLLLTTLWMPPLNYARSYAPLVQRMDKLIDAQTQAETPPSFTCLGGLNLSRAQIAALQFHGRHAFEPVPASALATTRCDWLLVNTDLLRHGPRLSEAIAAHWQPVARLAHPRPRIEEDVTLMRRRDAMPSASHP